MRSMGIDGELRVGTEPTRGVPIARVGEGGRATVRRVAARQLLHKSNAGRSAAPQRLLAHLGSAPARPTCHSA
jgi:hypothetical protein